MFNILKRGRHIKKEKYKNTQNEGGEDEDKKEE